MKKFFEKLFNAVQLTIIWMAPASTVIASEMFDIMPAIKSFNILAAIVFLLSSYFFFWKLNGD